MGGYTGKLGGRGLGMFLALVWIVVGTLQIVRGINVYAMDDIVTGVAMYLLAPFTLVLSGAPIPAVTARGWRYRGAMALGGLALLMMLVAYAGMVRDESPTAWLGLGRSVTTADLLAHPLLYNNIPVRMQGRAVATDRGCALIPEGRTAADADVQTPAGIRLAYRSDECPITAETPIPVEVSGTFRAFRATRDRAAFFVIDSPTIDAGDGARVPQS